MMVLFEQFFEDLLKVEGGFFKAPKVIKNLAWGLPFGCVSAALYDGWVSIAVLVSVTLLCALGKATGHGNFMDLGDWKIKSDDEALEFLIRPLRGRIPDYHYDAMGLVLVGWVAVLPAAIAMGVASSSPLVAALVAVIVATGGCLKSVAYMIGREVNKKHKTVIGEYLTGFFAFACLAIAYVMTGVDL